MGPPNPLGRTPAYSGVMPEWTKFRGQREPVPQAAKDLDQTLRSGWDWARKQFEPGPWTPPDPNLPELPEDAQYPWTREMSPAKKTVSSLLSPLTESIHGGRAAIEGMRNMPRPPKYVGNLGLGKVTPNPIASGSQVTPYSDVWGPTSKIPRADPSLFSPGATGVEAARGAAPPASGRIAPRPATPRPAPKIPGARSTPPKPDLNVGMGGAGVGAPKGKYLQGADGKVTSARYITESELREARAQHWVPWRGLCRARSMAA
jgi:hypothetical protein